LIAKKKNKKIMACHAKSHISDISKMVSKKATEVHGGMGFTEFTWITLLVQKNWCQ
jgi:hypothetical protein